MPSQAKRWRNKACRGNRKVKTSGSGVAIGLAEAIVPFVNDRCHLKSFELVLKYFSIIGSVSIDKKKSATENRTRAFSLQISLPYHYTTTLTHQNSEKFKDIL